MTIDECIKEYREFARMAFIPKSMRITTQNAFSAARLEGAIKSTIRKFCVEQECKSRRNQGLSTADTCSHENILFRDSTCTKTYARDCNETTMTKVSLFITGQFWQ